ncbi:ComF family protein [Clostridiisalibacter paucivorans]|uniref:ComF family protein n=1 Tax=Clostridiisalibacter paucivorans TaxID=408753 RepID=UPI00055105C1|nr:ComF family protein [Clostridiisalibacter paucivorans]
MIKEYLNACINLIYPEEGVCFICDEYYTTGIEDHICPLCRKHINRIGDHICSICGKPLEKGYIPHICHECIQFKRYFDRAIAPVVYEGRIKEAIHRYKYNKKPYMYKVFGPMMMKKLIEEDMDSFDIIVPVPLHRKRWINRGFNQSLLLAKYISKIIDKPIIDKRLIKKIDTTAQNKLDKIERLKNVKGAFKVKKGEIFKNKEILLIDDVFTTGATVNECSKILKEAGGKKVYVLTIARAVFSF